ncbi:WYL domain-containing protein [Streptomyces capparidis]
MRAARVISLLLLLQARRSMTAAELAAELEVSERTVQRDVQALAEAGVPVYAERGRAGGYRLLDGYRTRLNGLHRDEAEALFLSGLPGPVQEMGLADAALAARLKAAVALGPALRDAPEAAARRFHLDAPAWFRRVRTPELLGAVSRAVWGERAVRVRYRREDAAVTRTLEPYGLVLKAGVWYLAARVADGDGGGSSAYRVYRVDRFEAVEALEEPFDRDPDFDLAAFWEERSAAFARSLLRERITVRLSPEGARLLPALLSPEAGEQARGALAAAGEPDGQGWVTVTLATESLDVAHDEVLRLGAEAEVLGPPELRARVARTARRLSGLYEADGAADQR